MTQPQITSEIINSQLKMSMEVERGTFIVPSFDEIWPQPGKERCKARKRMGMEYILEVGYYYHTACTLLLTVTVGEHHTSYIELETN